MHEAVSLKSRDDGGEDRHDEEPKARPVRSESNLFVGLKGEPPESHSVEDTEHGFEEKVKEKVKEKERGRGRERDD